MRRSVGAEALHQLGHGLGRGVTPDVGLHQRCGGVGIAGDGLDASSVLVGLRLAHLIYSQLIKRGTQERLSLEGLSMSWPSLLRRMAEGSMSLGISWSYCRSTL